MTMPITVLVCGPALPPNPPQDDPAPHPAAERRRFREGTPNKNNNGGVSRPTIFFENGGFPAKCYHLTVF